MSDSGPDKPRDGADEESAEDAGAQSASPGADGGTASPQPKTWAARQRLEADEPESEDEGDFDSLEGPPGEEVEGVPEEDLDELPQEGVDALDEEEELEEELDDDELADGELARELERGSEPDGVAAQETVDRGRRGRREVRLHQRPFRIAHRRWIATGDHAILIAGVVRPHIRSPGSLSNSQ